MLLLTGPGCGGELAVAADGRAAPLASATHTGLTSRELSMVLFKGGWSPADVTLGQLPRAEPFMPPPPARIEPDFSGALAIEWQMSDAREGPGRWGGAPDTTQRFTLVVHTGAAQKVALGRWHYTMCTIAHSRADMPDSGPALAQLICTGNGAGLSFSLVRRRSGETVDVHVHEGSDGLDGPTYRQGIVGQVQVPRRRAIHLKKSDRGSPDSFEEDTYFPLE